MKSAMVFALLTSCMLVSPNTEAPELPRPHVFREMKLNHVVQTGELHHRPPTTSFMVIHAA